MSIPANDFIKKTSIKDETGLNDFHRVSNQLKVAIDKVGINRYRIPLNYVYKDGMVRNHDTEASMYVQCPEGSTGINMSRLCEFLLAESEKQSVGKDFFEKVLTRFRRDMRDEESEAWFERAYLKLKFKYALKQTSLKSENWGWQYYDCELEGCQDKDGKTRMYLTVKYEYSSTCP